uniref:Uncharacterized protein n=1 Tax=Octopus bimaculoides TaxID=37653 RepID=A0A0L8GN76_OCTBM
MFKFEYEFVHLQSFYSIFIFIFANRKISLKYILLCSKGYVLFYLLQFMSLTFKSLPWISRGISLIFPSGKVWCFQLYLAMKSKISTSNMKMFECHKYRKGFIQF